MGQLQKPSLHPTWLFLNNWALLVYVQPLLGREGDPHIALNMLFIAEHM